MAGLKPEEFWNMTPREFEYWMDGFKWRMDNEALIKAHFTACIMNMFSNKRIRATDLWKIGNPTKKRKNKINKETAEELLSRIGPEAIPIRRK